MKEKSRAKSLISEYFIFVIFIALVVVLTCLKPSFIQPANLVNILKQASINGILAFGMMFVIIAGGFDMSVGSTVAFTGILAAMLGQGQYPIFVPLIVAMLGGLAVGVVNGVGVAVGNLPPFIMTLGTMTAVRGESYEMDAITACVVGGVSMTGGVGKPWGVVIGCLLITVIANGLDIMGVSSHWQKIVKGAIIVLAVLIDVKGKSKKR